MCHHVYISVSARSKTVVNNIYVGDDENQMAVDIAKPILTGSIYAKVWSDHTLDAKTHGKSKKKTAQNVDMRLKKRQKQFTGDLALCWKEYREDYK